jgi:hypothetical protein
MYTPERWRTLVPIASVVCFSLYQHYLGPRRYLTRCGHKQQSVLKRSRDVWQEVLARWYLPCHRRTMRSREKPRFYEALLLASGKIVSACLPSRLSRVRVPSPAPRPISRAFIAARRCFLSSAKHPFCMFSCQFALGSRSRRHSSHLQPPQQSYAPTSACSFGAWAG